jgi:sodium-dependent dicarboxylate transporter 2/3/5
MQPEVASDGGSVSAWRAAISFSVAVALSLALYVWMPYETSVTKGLCLLVFIGALWLSEAIPLPVTALLVPVGALALGIPGMTTVKALTPFADPIVFLFLGGFALASALRVQQLDRKMAVFLLALSNGHLGRTVWLLFAVTGLLSMAISNTATAAMVLPLALGILGPLDPQRERRTFAFVLLGVAYAASIGGMGTLVGSPPNAIAARAAGIGFSQWLWIGLPLVLVLMPLMVFVLSMVLRPNLDRRIAVTATDIPWTWPRVITLSVFVFTALGWTFGAEPLKDLGIQSPDTVFALVAAIAVVALRLASWRNVSEHTDWGVLILFGGGLALGEVLASSGASLVLGQQLAAVLQGAAPWAMLLTIAMFMVLLSEFASNTAAAALLVPVFAAVATQMGLPAEMLVVVVALAASCGFALPVATPPNALVFGSGRVRQRDMLWAGLSLDLVCVAVLTLWGLISMW